MKIAISASGQGLDGFLDPRFGRCDYFLLYDTVTKDVKAVANQGKTSSQGAGIAAAQQLIDEKVDIIITGSLGPNAFALINRAGIKAYQGETMSVKSVLEKHDKGELVALEDAGPSHHGMGRGYKGGN